MIRNFEFFAAEAFAVPSVFEARFAALVKLTKTGEAQPPVAVPSVPSSGGKGGGDRKQDGPAGDLPAERGVDEPDHDGDCRDQNPEADAIGGFGVADPAVGIPNLFLNFGEPRDGG